MAQQDVPRGLSRVALIFGTFPPSTDGGAEFVCNLSRHLAQAGLEVHVITSTEWARFDPASMPTGFRLWPVIEDWRLRSRSDESAARLLRTLASVRPQIAHIVYPSSRHGNDYQLPVVIKGSGPWRVVVTFFSMYLLKGVTWRTRLNSLRLMTTSDVVTTHDPVYLRILRTARPHRAFGARFVPVGSNVEVGQERYTPEQVCQRQKELGLAPGQYLAHFGRVDASRDVATLMRSVALLRDSGRNVRVLMIGAESPDWRTASGEHQAAQRDTAEAAAALGQEVVTWTGYASQRDVARYMLASDCAVLPFLRNTLGRSSLALALKLGMPVVTSGRGRNAFLQDRANVLLVPPRRPRALASAIGRLLDSADLRRQISARARQAAVWYSWETVTARTLMAYDDALRHGGFAAVAADDCGPP